MICFDKFPLRALALSGILIARKTYPDTESGVRIRRLVRDGLLSEMDQHPDLGLMCCAAMWRAALSTALCVGTFTCAVALIDACLRVNTQSECLVRIRHVSRRTTDFPIQLQL